MSCRGRQSEFKEFCKRLSWFADLKFPMTPMSFIEERPGHLETRVPVTICFPGMNFDGNRPHENTAQGYVDLFIARDSLQ